MNKKLLLLLILLLASMRIDAQILGAPFVSIGIKGGGTITDMVYTQQDYNIYSHKRDYDYLGGVFVQYRPTNRLGLLTDVQYSGAGVKLNWADIYYTLHAKYVDLRLLAAFHYGKVREHFSPYFILGPAVGITQSGLISYESDYTPYFTTPLTTGDFARIDGGLYAGWGMDYTFYWGYKPVILSLEIGYRAGLISTFSTNDQSNDAIILNPELDAPLYSKKRLNQGLEAALRLSIPLKEGKKKSQTSRIVSPYYYEYEDEVVEVDTIPIIPDFSSRYERKECYTLGEIRHKVENDEDVSGLRICLFNIHFDFDKDEVKPESYRVLADLASIMRKYPEMIIKVNGHTDSYGSDEYNQDLSERRANAVKHAIQGYGIMPDRIQWEGYGEKYPIDTNETDEGRARNRRVEIDILTIPKTQQIKTK